LSSIFFDVLASSLRWQGAPYKAGGGAITPSGAGGKLATNVASKEAAGTISRDKTLVNSLVNILIGISATIGEDNGKHTGACVVGCFLEEGAV